MTEGPDATECARAAIHGVSAEPRNTERCPQCGYLLYGLPDAGRCPECGQAYDQAWIVIEGWAGGTSDMVLARASRRPRALLGSLLWALLIGLMIWLDVPGNLRWLALLPPAAIIACYAATHREAEDAPPMQLILSPQGYLGRTHPAARSAVLLHSTVATVLNVGYLFVMLLDSPRFALGFTAVYVAGILLVVGLGRRRAKRRSGATLTASGEAVILKPWETGCKVTLKGRSAGTWHITIGKPLTKRAFLSFRPTLTVNAPPLRIEADISDDRLAHITSQLAAWPVKVTVVPGKR